MCDSLFRGVKFSKSENQSALLQKLLQHDSVNDLKLEKNAAWEKEEKEQQRVLKNVKWENSQASCISSCVWETGPELISQTYVYNLLFLVKLLFAPYSDKHAE